MYEGKAVAQRWGLWRLKALDGGPGEGPGEGEDYGEGVGEAERYERRLTVATCR